MKVQRNEIHAKQVEIWEKQSACNLSLKDRIYLFEKAIHAIEKRTLMTLSSVTLRVVLDRVLHQCKEKFPQLVEIQLESESLNFDDFLFNVQNKGSDEAIEALRYLLVELLSILGGLTADILTDPLHKALFEVTSKIDPTENKPQILKKKKSSKKTPEEK